MNSITGEQSFEHFLMRLLLTVLCTTASVVVLCLLATLVPVQVPTPDELSRIVYISLASVKPEPLERRMFLLSVITLPAVIFCWNRFWERFLGGRDGKQVRRNVTWACAALFCSLGVFCWVTRDELAFFVRGKSSGIIWWFAVALLAGGICLSLVRGEKLLLRIVDAALAITVAILVSTIFLYGLSDLSTVTDSYAFTNHFNVIFHAVVQVFQGKELLQDFMHQYGLYPHFLEPLLKLTGLGVFTFTAVMGILTVFTLVLILRTMLAATTSRTVALLGFLATISFCYAFKVMAAYDPYFQYFPLRTIFPALAAWLMVGFVTKRSAVRFAVLYVASASAVLWNPETGIVVMIAVLLTTLYDAYPRVGLRGGLVSVGKGAGIASAVMVLFSGYMHVRYGSVPDYAELIRYIKLFYVTGYFMLPMPVLHPWNIVALVYIAGLAWGIGAVVNGNVTDRTTVVTFLSLLGIGLFAYYQGRSHNEVLLLCSYPAFMLVTINSDRLLVRGRGCRTAFCTGMAGVVFLAVVAGGLWRGGLFLLAGPFGIVQRYAASRSAEPSEVMKRAEFVRNNTARGEEVLILSTHSGIYHLASQTTNPVRIPSILEIVLTEDYLRILDHLENVSCRKIFVDYWLMAEDGPEKELRTILASRYAPVSMTPDLSLVLYARVR